MCFYRDTQFALNQRNLQNLIHQRSHHPEKVQTLPKPEIYDVSIRSEPYKKLHLAKDLYDDLLKLAANGIDSVSERSTDESLETGGFRIVKQESFDNTQTKYSQQDITPRAEERTTKSNGKVEITADLRFLDSVLSLIESNTKTLSGFSATQHKISDNLQQCAESTQIYQQMDESPFERLERMSQIERHHLQYNSNPTSDDVLNQFTKGRTRFPYELVLSAELSAPVFRERNLKIQIKLISKSDNSLVTNHGNMLLQMSLHTWELPSVAILRNKTGNKVLQGEDECELKNGEAIFDKIQINEVTSKFIGGYIGVIVVPKRPVNFGTSLESLYMKNSVRIEDIKPLLISKLVVKSKKKSNKAQNEGNGME